MNKTIKIQYFAILREQRGVSVENITTSARTAHELYLQLQTKYHFSLSSELVRVAINNQFSDWVSEINSGDQVVFIPPVAGG